MFVIFDNTNGKEWFLPNAREDFEVMQYTGIKDKKGKEIYEGDILQKQGYWSWYVAFEDCTFVTVPCLSVQAMSREHNRLRKDLVDGWEIIGNIYENGELLNPDASERRDEHSIYYSNYLHG